MSDWSTEDRQYMALAIQLARKGWYSTHPNPRVGCVIVHQGMIVGEGWHVRAGEDHAEVNALRQSGDRAQGATAYVTLEPCSHFGKTPPCAQALVDAGIEKVVVAMVDPNPLVAGKGLRMLEEAGVETSSGLLAEQAAGLNPGFIKRMSDGRPYVRLKIATSVDGRTAMSSGESKWITGEDARQDVHRLRAAASAILSTARTILEDDARLTVRLEKTGFPDAIVPEPVRIVLDKQVELRGDEAFFRAAGPVLYVYNSAVQPAAKVIAHSNVRCIGLPLNEQGYFDLPALLRSLGSSQINEVLIESGSGLAGQCIEQDCVDELILYVAPKLMGSNAKPMAALNLDKMSEVRELRLLDMRQVGEDIRFTYTFK